MLVSSITSRTEVARESFLAERGREPIDARELAGQIAKNSRPRTQTVAGYDLTFSPMLALVLELVIRSLEEDRPSKDEHLARLREVPKTGNCKDGNAAGYCRPGVRLARVDAAADLLPAVLGAVAHPHGAADDVDLAEGHHLRRHQRELTG